MDCRYIVLFLILSQVAFADCVGYNDSFDVRVLDAKYRPVPDAEVQVTYDRGATFGEQYFTTPAHYTDSEGKAHFIIFNQGTTARKMDCDIDITGSAGGSKKAVTVVANQHGPIVDVVLNDVYPARFYVRDQLGKPLEDASVTLGTKTGKTDENGLIKFFYKTGSYDYLASYLDARQAGSLAVSDDTEFEVLFTYHGVVVDVVDDTGNPLNATLAIFNESFQLEDGHFEYEKTFGEMIPYSVTYKGIPRTGTIETSIDPTIIVVYDVHSPLFGEITTDIANNWTKLLIGVSDPGDFASGVDVSSIRVTYRLEPADPTDPWNTAVTFTTGYNTFTADFPELPPNSIVGFRIEITDKTGNRADIEGKFSTFRPEIPQNYTQNQTDTQPTGPEEQEIPLFYMIGGGILVILVVYLVFRIKSMAAEGV